MIQKLWENNNMNIERNTCKIYFHMNNIIILNPSFHPLSIVHCADDLVVFVLSIKIRWSCTIKYNYTLNDILHYYYFTSHDNNIIVYNIYCIFLLIRYIIYYIVLIQWSTKGSRAN